MKSIRKFEIESKFQCHRSHFCFLLEFSHVKNFPVNFVRHRQNAKFITTEKKITIAIDIKENFFADACQNFIQNDKCDFLRPDPFHFREKNSFPLEFQWWIYYVRLITTSKRVNKIIVNQLNWLQNVIQ